MLPAIAIIVIIIAAGVAGALAVKRKKEEEGERGAVNPIPVMPFSLYGGRAFFLPYMKKKPGFLFFDFRDKLKMD